MKSSSKEQLKKGLKDIQIHTNSRIILEKINYLNYG